MRMDVILRVTAKLFIPFILLFGLYVQLHGDFGPGGGFQAGVIVAAAIILYAIIWGQGAALKVAPPWLVESLVPLGVLIFAGVGIAGITTGGNYLDYNGLVHSPPTKEEAVHGQHWGVFLVEIGVLVTVASTMLAIFYAFAGRGRK
ncbi:MAG: Na(+)/H(+) antiporter subunit B [Pseudomonadota bacterium]